MSDPRQHPIVDPTMGDPAASDLTELDASLVETLFLNELMALDGSSSSSSLPGNHPALATAGFGFPLGFGLEGDDSDAVAGAAADVSVTSLTDAAAAAMNMGGMGFDNTSIIDSGGPPFPLSPSLSPTPASGAAAVPSPLPSPAIVSGELGAAMSGSATGTTASAANRATSNDATAASSTMTAAESPAEERAQHLVRQFASLAGRLGIVLPSHVLSSLATAAAANDMEGKDHSDSNVSASGAQSAQVNNAEQTEVSRKRPLPALNPNPDPIRSMAPAAHPIASATAFRAAPTPVATAKPAAQAPASKTAPQTQPQSQPRRKKKPRLDDCRARLEQLQAENATLRRHLSNVTAKTTVIDREREKAERRLGEMVKAYASVHSNANPQKEAEVQTKVGPVLKQFGELYSDYGRRRQEELTFHLEQLERLAAPTNITKMTLWTCGQSDHFFLKPKSNPIAGILMKELDITPVQGRKIIERRDKIRDLNDNIRRALALMAKLKSLCEHKQKVFHDRMTKCQEILSPLQVAKLLVWVDDHADTLEAVCPGWGSERIHAGPSNATATPSRSTSSAPTQKKSEN